MADREYGQDILPRLEAAAEPRTRAAEVDRRRMVQEDHREDFR